jgi:NitT/TauT family transport system substrate-binding protein
MKKYILVVVFAIFAVVLFFVVKNKINVKKEIKSVSVCLKWLDQAQFAGFYVAKNEGLYKNANLDVTLNPGGPDVSPIQMVVSKVDQFGITGADQIILARAKGVPVVALTVIYKESPVAIGSLKKNNILLPKDLIGKKVGMIYGRDEETIYRALLAKENIDPKSINEVALLPGLTQLTTSAIDAQILYEMNEPVLLAEQGFQVNLIKPRDYGINFYSDTLFTTEDMIKQNPEEVRNFIEATVEGWNSAFKNPEQAVNQVLSVNSSLDRTQQTKFLQLSEPLINGEGKIGYSDKNIWEEMQNTLLSEGLLKNPIDIDKAFTNSFLK